MRNKLFIFFLFCLLLGFPKEIAAVNSSVTDSISVTTKRLYLSDSLLKKNKTTDNLVYPKRFEENFQTKYGSDEFDYSLTKPKESLWEKIERQLEKLIEAIFGNIDPVKTERYTRITIWTISSLIIVFALFQLIKFLLNKRGNYFFSKKNKRLPIPMHNLEENIHEINFDERIATFENKEEYRSAVRYQFLSVLKHLADTKQIHWNPEKTNQDYSQELQNKHQKQEFEEPVYIFDYIWYGEFEIDKTAYSYFKQKFINFKIKSTSVMEAIDFEQDSDNHE